MIVHCEIYDELDDDKDPLVIESQHCVLKNRIYVKLGDVTYTVDGKELIKAIQNCMND